MPIVLASASPRRQELLALCGIPFQVQPASVPEIPLPGETAADFVQRMSRLKAEQAAETSPPDAVVIGADTEVALGQRIFGKPTDATDAAAMLHQLRGRTHVVLTGLTVLDKPSGTRLTDLVTARVPMRDYPDEDIDAYVASGDPLDKAGGYAIQYSGFQPVDLERFEDCFATVMGLPVCRALSLIRRLRPELAPLPAPGRPLGDCRRFNASQCFIVPAIRPESSGAAQGAG